MNTNIDGLTTETISSSTGGDVIRFYAEGRNKNRFIQIKLGLAGSADIALIEGKTSPGIDIGETQSISRDADIYANRIIRAMATLYLGVDEARDGYATIDVEMVRRGFHITFAPDGQAAWLRQDGSTVIVISQTNEGGLPFPGDFIAQAIIRGAVGGVVTAYAPSIFQLLAYVDNGVYARHLIPGQEYEFWLSPDVDKKKLN
jgi:hypothetical protein